MPVKVDDVLEQAKGLGQALDNHKAVIITKGNGQKKIDDLNSSYQNLIKNNSSQVAAETFMEQKTQEKNNAIQAGLGVVTQIQEAAKSAFEGDKVKEKEFRIGADKPQSAKGLTTLLDYLTGVVQKYSDVLIANGMTQDDIANVSTVYANLIAADAVQKNAAKLRNAATEARDSALAALKTKITATRNFAKVAFKGDQAALEEIKPIPNTRAKGKPPAPPAPEPPQTTPQK